MGMEETSKRWPFFSSPEELFDDEYYDDQPPEKKRRLTQEQVFKQSISLFLSKFRWVEMELSNLKPELDALYSWHIPYIHYMLLL